MLGRKGKNQPEQGRQRQARRAPMSDRPAFSYYASRSPAATQARSPRRDPVAANPPGKRWRLPLRLRTAQLPFWVLLVVIVICVVKLLLLGTNPKIIVLGRTAATSTYIRSPDTYAAAAHKLLASSITNRTKLTADTGGVSRALRHEFPELQTVSLALPLIGNRPIVYVQAAPPSLVIQTEHGNFAINSTGVVLAQLQALPGGVPTVVDQSNDNPHAGKQFLPSSTVRFVQTLQFQLAAAKLPVSAYVLPAASPYELDLRLDGKPYLVKFNLQADVLTQSGAVVATIGQLGSAGPSTYLDVRTPGRVYYK